MATNLGNLGYKVSSRQLNWLQMVERAWGSEFNAPDHGIYEWSNGRKFDSTDKGTTGIYNDDFSLDLLQENPQYPDMAGALLLLENDGVLQMG